MTSARAAIRLISVLVAVLGPLSARGQVSGARPEALSAPATRDGSHDFDFEIGVRKAHIARRLRPLTGSNDWVEYDGVSTVRKIWQGKANVGELDVSGLAGAIMGASLRFYDPRWHQWRISWVNSTDGVVTPVMIGGFDGSGRGEFYNQDVLGDRPIFVRFVFTGTNHKSFRIEQAFSADAGKTWEINWIADFTP